MNRLLSVCAARACLLFGIVSLSQLIRRRGFVRGRAFSCVFVALTAFAAGVESWAVEYNFTNIVDTTMVGPNGGAFTSFAFPSVSGNTVAFVGSYTGVFGVFTGSGGSLTTIAKQGDAGPTRPFNSFGETAISGSSVAFIGIYDDPGRGVFVSSGGALTTIAKTGDSVPNGVLGTNFGPPAISGSTVAFIERFGFGAIYAGDGGPLTLIAKAGDPAPIGAFTQLFDVDMYGDTVVSSGDGVFQSRNGALQTIAKSGDAAPFGTFHCCFRDTSISGDRIAFLASDGAGPAIFTSTPSTATAVVVRVGDAGPSGTINVIWALGLSGDTTAFLASFGELETEGIFLSKNGAVLPLITAGGPLFGGSVASFSARSTSGLNEFATDRDPTGQVVFAYRLTDGRRGIALATPIPEPTFHSSFFVAAVIMFYLRGERRSQERDRRFKQYDF
jgi:hypothetical protein